MKRKWLLQFAPVLFVVGAITGCVPIPQGSTVDVPIQGTVWDQAANEMLWIQGDTHLVAQTTKDGQSEKLHINYQGLTATGETSHKTYRIVGAGNSNNGTLTVQANFFGPLYQTTIHVVGNHSDSNISVTFEVFENTNGQYHVGIGETP